MTAWTNQLATLPQGPLFFARWVRPGVVCRRHGADGDRPDGDSIHRRAVGLAPGQAITSGGEIRFVTAVANSTTIFVNAPFTVTPTTGAAIGPTITYGLANDLSSVSIYDYWDPSTAVQRIVESAAMDKMQVKVNGDFQEFEFSGPARDLLDSASFTSGDGGLTQYPAEPSTAGFDYTIVPGHLGQVWMGSTPDRFFTVTAADLVLANNIALRLHEFGNDFPRCITAGVRDVTFNFSLFEAVDAQTAGLYQAARQRSPIGVMLQLGEQAEQLFGAYMPAMIPEVPEFDDNGNAGCSGSFSTARRKERSMTSSTLHLVKPEVAAMGGHTSSLWLASEKLRASAISHRAHVGGAADRTGAADSRDRAEAGISGSGERCSGEAGRGGAAGRHRSGVLGVGPGSGGGVGD